VASIDVPIPGCGRRGLLYERLYDIADALGQDGTLIRDDSRRQSDEDHRRGASASPVAVLFDDRSVVVVEMQ
jgi:hypothetical protein